eukprot:4788972-Alexandrium_andersonii.AAC.1
MSASLMGSEMCIRDRTGRARKRSPTRPPGLPARHGSAPGARHTSAMENCLLYTSDAADDM